jgi:hypothetical protein
MRQHNPNRQQTSEIRISNEDRIVKTALAQNQLNIEHFDIGSLYNCLRLLFKGGFGWISVPAIQLSAFGAFSNTKLHVSAMIP